MDEKTKKAFELLVKQNQAMLDLLTLAVELCNLDAHMEDGLHVRDRHALSYDASSSLERAGKIQARVRELREEILKASASVIVLMKP